MCQDDATTPAPDAAATTAGGAAAGVSSDSADADVAVANATALPRTAAPDGAATAAAPSAAPGDGTILQTTKDAAVDQDSLGGGALVITVPPDNKGSEVNEIPADSNPVKVVVVSVW